MQTKVKTKGDDNAVIYANCACSQSSQNAD